MLSKLLKYEIKATARIFLPLMAVLLIFAGVNRLIFEVSPSEWQAADVISFILYLTIFVGMMIMTLIVMIQRFYRNLLSDEGYLSFTLPVKVWKHITCKLLVSVMWSLVSGVLGILSMFIIGYGRFFNGQFLQLAFESSMLLEGTNVLLLFEIVLAVLVSLASGILIVYASIALGHLVNRHRILASIGAFIGLNTVTQIIFAAVGSLGSYIPFESFTLTTDTEMMQLIHYTMWFCIIFTGLLSAGYFALTNFILGRRLNLE